MIGPCEMVKITVLILFIFMLSSAIFGVELGS